MGAFDAVQSLSATNRGSRISSADNGALETPGDIFIDAPAAFGIVRVVHHDNIANAFAHVVEDDFEIAGLRFAHRLLRERCVVIDDEAVLERPKLFELVSGRVAGVRCLPSGEEINRTGCANRLVEISSMARFSEALNSDIFLSRVSSSSRCRTRIGHLYVTVTFLFQPSGRRSKLSVNDLACTHADYGLIVFRGRKGDPAQLAPEERCDRDRKVLGVKPVRRDRVRSTSQASQWRRDDPASAGRSWRAHACIRQAERPRNPDTLETQPVRPTRPRGSASRSIGSPALQAGLLVPARDLARR